MRRKNPDVLDASPSTQCRSCVHRAQEHADEQPSPCLVPLCPCAAFVPRPEHRLVMSGEMVLATVAERFQLPMRKTVTRRLVVHPGRRLFGADAGEYICLDPTRRNPLWRFLPRGMRMSDTFPEDVDVRGRTGCVGDRLWVSETFAVREGNLVAYRADGACGAWIGDGGGGSVWIPHGWVTKYEHRATHHALGGRYALERYGGRWTTPRFMPRRFARILLGTVSVRVEPLHAIDDDEIAREGIVPSRDESPREAFARAWNKLHLRDGLTAQWEANPWVWRTEFQREVPALPNP